MKNIILSILLSSFSKGANLELIKVGFLKIKVSTSSDDDKLKSLFNI